MIGQNILLAWNSIRAAKLRSFLTMLGVIIGVVGVVSVVSIGEGIKKEVRGEIEAFGTDLVQVNPGKSEGGFNIAALFGSGTMTNEDVADIKALDNIEMATPITFIDAQVRGDGKEVKGASVIGTDSGYLAVTNQKIKYGGFLNENITNPRVAVIGSSLADELFGGKEALGRTISLRGKEFAIIGVTEKYESILTSLSSGFDLNKMVYIPMAGARQLEGGAVRIVEIDAKVDDTARLNDTVENMKVVLKENRGGDDNFTVTKSEEIAKTTDSILSAVTAGISGLASISVLVGIVGIMNIMFTIVTERTREIGIRKSIGASNGHILTQFLVESILISLIGALIGIGIAFGIGMIIRVATSSLEPRLTIPFVLAVLIFSVVVGVIAGLWPAVRAARKDPVDALRYE